MYLTSQSLKSTQPDNCEIKLWNHQLSMLHRCSEIETDQDIGIISDQPGSGKTFVILALINQTIRLSSHFPKLTNLIVVTNNIYNQWLEAFQYFPNLTYHKFNNYEDISSLYFNSDILKQ